MAPYVPSQMLHQICHPPNLASFSIPELIFSLSLAPFPLGGLSGSLYWPDPTRCASPQLCAKLLLWEQGFSTDGNFALKETFCNARRHFWLSQLGEGCYQHPMHGGQGGCWTPHSAREGPTTKNHLVQKTRGAEFEKSLFFTLGPKSSSFFFFFF